MKKIISILISLILVLTSVYQGLFVFAEENSKKNNIKIFAENLSQMIRENNTDDFSKVDEVYMNPMFSSATVTDFETEFSSYYENMADDAFETCRLIVKSKDKIDYLNAIDCVSGYNDLYVLQFDSEYSTKAAYEYYLQCNTIEYVEPDLIVKAAIDDVPGEDLPDDEANAFDEVTAAALEWLSDKIGFSDIKDKLLERIEDDYVLVAVIDSGVDTDHELFVDRLVESDVNLSTTGISNSAEDDYGHGTHVAGIVANNTLSNVKIKPYKVLNRDGNGSLSSISIAVDMAVADGADIINMSLSANGESQLMTDAINNAVANDINVVVAAGNTSTDLDKNYICPANVESAITVSATDRNDKLASFSNYDGTIDIAAPGTDIESSYLNNTYLSLSGTSMSAPQVSAGLAIIQTISKDKPASESEEMIKEYAIKVFENEGENHFGSGILFLKYLLDGKPTVANPVFSVDSCTFSEKFQVELSCPDEDADIYYVIYNTNLDSVNWFDSFKYSKPITITVDTKISAFAYADGKYPSSIVTVEYDRIGETVEDYYEINSLGYITGYYNSEINVVVPEVINGITVKGIATKAFAENNTANSIILPDSCTKINVSAFMNCSALEYISGAGVTDVGVNAFEDSTVETVNFPNLKSIGIYGFEDCRNLNSITLANVDSVGAYAFQGTSNLGDIVLNSATSIGASCFNQSGITSFEAPELITMGINAFNDCYNLHTVTLPKLEVVPLGAFKNCISLKNVHVSSTTEIGANAFRNSSIENFYGKCVTNVGNYAFADNSFLELVYLPATTSTGTNVFLNCTALKIVGLPVLEELNSNTFSNCTSLLNLYLPNATSIAKNGFKNSSIQLLKLEKIETISNLPDKLQAIVLPSTVTSISASTPSTDFTVYGFDDTFAEQYASDVGKKFEPVPAIYHKTSESVSIDEKYIVVYAIGFKCNYQWYRNDTVSNEGGTPIEGAIRFYYEPSPEDDCAAYYCVITSTNGMSTATSVTNPMPNAPEYRSADYTEYNKLIEEINTLDRDLYDKEYLEQLDKLLETDISGLKLTQQDTVDAFVSQLSVTLELVKNSFIMGDLNGDNHISAIDVRFVLKYVAGIQSFTNYQLKVGDMDGDGAITAVDARLIMLKALEL